MDDDHPLQLHIPHFVYSSAPTLVPGGGAEVIPLTNADWFANNGFTPFQEFFAPNEPGEHQQADASGSAPFDFALPAQPTFASPPPVHQPTPDLSLFVSTALAAPSPLGLPVYSSSGFDLLSILARVVHRPYPRVVLGPVDLSCSFVVVDVRRYDHPIVYCSPTFCTLTGYSEAEVIGRNCRFLQAPGGQVAKGEPRKYTAEDAVAHLRKSLMADKECQTSIVNYKKNGAAFINLVTVIPVPGGSSGEENDIAYHVGFQVDLTDQPNAILEKLKDGSYIVNYAAQSDMTALARAVNRQIQPPSLPPTTSTRERKANSIPGVVMSKQLKRLLADPVFLRSFPIPNAGPVPATNASSAEEAVIPGGSNHLLHLFLLEAAPDFIHVVSLKGSFLYVAPSVRRVLGYEAEEMIGTSLADYAHPEDVIPLMRELKESSATGVTSAAASASVSVSTSAGAGADTGVGPSAIPGAPRSVDLLFRARTKMGRYVWVECRGRLHVEPGKGRKAIILSGRAREMMCLRWEDVNRAGGLAEGRRVPVRSGRGSTGLGKEREREGGREQPRWMEETEQEQEVWGMLGGTGAETATFLSVGRGMRDVLGWTGEDLLGTGVVDIVRDEGARGVIGGFVREMREVQRGERLGRGRGQGQRERGNTHTRHGRGPPGDGTRMRKTRCFLTKKDGGVVEVWFVLYRADADAHEEGGEGKAVGVDVDEARGVGMSISPASLVYQIRLVDAVTVPCGVDSVLPALLGATAGSFSSSTSTSMGPLVTSTSASSTLSSSSSMASSAAASTGPSLDMFDELSIARGSSWQYELQQLRFANSRLLEELAVLEAAEAEAEAADVGGGRKERLLDRDRERDRQEREREREREREADRDKERGKERDRQLAMQGVSPPTTTAPMVQSYDPLGGGGGGGGGYEYEYEYEASYGDESNLHRQHQQQREREREQQQQQQQQQQQRERDLFSRQRLMMRQYPPPPPLPTPLLSYAEPHHHRSLYDSLPHPHSLPLPLPLPLSPTEPRSSTPSPSSAAVTAAAAAGTSSSSGAAAAWLHQPQPQAQFSLREMTQGLVDHPHQHPHQHQHHQHGQRRGSQQQQQQAQEWSTMAPPPPPPLLLGASSLGYAHGHHLIQPQPLGYATSGTGAGMGAGVGGGGGSSSLKRPWDAIDST